MRILIIGGTGTAGQRIAEEALDRGYTVTIASRRGGAAGGHGHERHERVGFLRVDSAHAHDVADAAASHDVVVGATRPAVGREHDVIGATHGLAAGAGTAGTRLLVVGGAGPLKVPGSGRLVLDDTGWVPTGIRPIATASNRQLDILREFPDTEWTYLAPAAHFAPGRRTGTYAAQEDELVIAPDGTSAISMEDYAIALVDAAETPGSPRRVLALGPAR